jgi:hypothetical protein
VLYGQHGPAWAPLPLSLSLSPPAGNEQMKLENFEAAVHLYGKAIELNPANAVYFCNRCGWCGGHW